jgi:hypothetical protein
MRLWSIHPSLLDAKGLVALWREALLAQAVLSGRTNGYRHHPQLERFQQSAKPILAIATYLREVHAEAGRRGYHFDGAKIAGRRNSIRLRVTAGQLDYEFRHLKKKLRTRDPASYRAIRSLQKIPAHPMFRIVTGGIAEWERR